MAFGVRWSEADIKKAQERQAPKENKKIMGATKVEMDGIKFASKLELYFYNLLKSTKITFDFQVIYVLQDKFRFNGMAIREIKSIVDFYLPDYDMIVDTKGYQTPDSKIKFKMLKHKLYMEGKTTRIELPSTKKECEALINILISEKQKG